MNRNLQPFLMLYVDAHTLRVETVIPNETSIKMYQIIPIKTDIVKFSVLRVQHIYVSWMYYFNKNVRIETIGMV